MFQLLSSVTLFTIGSVHAVAVVAQEAPPLVTVRSDSVMIRFVETELRTAVQAMARYMDRPVIFAGLGDARVTLETPRPVSRNDLPILLRGLLSAHHHTLTEDSAYYRVEHQQSRGGGNPVAGQPQGAGGTAVQLFVIRLRHASAPDVAATVNALYGKGGALGEPGAAPVPLGEQLRQSRIPPVSGNAPPIAVRPQPATLSGEITIVPDAGTNSLLIRASQADFELIEAAVEQLDIRPLQVLIEVLIAEVRRDRSFSFGLGISMDTINIRDGGSRATGSNVGLGLGDFVLSVMDIGGLDLHATLRAAAARGDVSISSRPVLVAANNQSASILVGSQRPFVQVSRSLPTDNPVRDQVVQYKDVGTQLTIRPTISADGYVMLDVLQEVNAATSETAFEAPVISTRSVQTRVLVKDGQTAVMGGLTDQQRDRMTSGVPLLSSLPLIGGLFGASTRRSVGTELFVFLTPRLIRTDEDVEAATQPLLERSNRIKHE